MQSLVALIVVALGISTVSAYPQNITVKGIAVCNKHRQANAHVQLFDRDTLDPNDLLGEVHTNKDGEFELFGTEDEIGAIDPFIRIHHSCNVDNKKCTRVSDYTVPQDKIGQVYDMTYVTLDIVVHGETEKCD